MMRAPQLVVALDVGNTKDALTLVENLAPQPLWMKVGLELFTAEGPASVREIARRCPVFLDLKFHDIPNTVRGATRSATRLGVSMLTLHLCGGAAMAEGALSGRREALERLQAEGVFSFNAPGAGKSSAKGHPPNMANAVNGPLLMGITELTSTAPHGIGGMDALRERVRAYALDAKACGLDGVVCSGLEVGLVKEACGSDFLCLCPGVRFTGTAVGDDQSRVCTPQDAVRAGADFLVMGRPITQAKNPAETAAKALHLMSAALR